MDFFFSNSDEDKENEKTTPIVKEIKREPLTDVTEIYYPKEVKIK